MTTELEDFINNILNGEDEQSKINFKKFAERKTSELLGKGVPSVADNQSEDPKSKEQKSSE